MHTEIHAYHHMPYIYYSHSTIHTYIHTYTCRTNTVRCPELDFGHLHLVFFPKFLLGFHLLLKKHVKSHYIMYVCMYQVCMYVAYLLNVTSGEYSVSLLLIDSALAVFVPTIV